MKKLILFLVIILLILGVGCNDKEIEEGNSLENTEESEGGSNNNGSKDNVFSPLSGIKMKSDLKNERPIAIMFDNQKDARWQAGLSEAEIVYEFLVEGNITRYMGIFLMNSPDVIGPVRSARPYYLQALLEYDAIYVHCGGSPEAKEQIISFGIDEADCMSAPGYVFYRNNELGKKSPHNLYTNMEDIRKYEKEKGFNTEPNYEPFLFNENSQDIEGEVANTLKINYSKHNTTSYKYDEEIGKYIRYKDGEIHIDENDSSNLTATNIIIQEANTKVIDNQGRLHISTIGEGKGKYFTKGKYININWEKEDQYSKTKYFDEAGNRIKLNPGITWIQVTRVNPEIKITE
ncbi:DUF3048 domain-containing protein [Senegalia massiliensis]|uniref:DUF3048 domain-containing protein n=1 Tax=Senegalia massiliensis TaxID=1720316 RepID=UPI001F5E9408|nr:DUF3048 domain-containing protein [Senegalia massiliensis]